MSLEEIAPVIAQSSQTDDDLLSTREVTIKTAWERINKNSYQTIFILDSEGKILGSLSDGDIRRWVLAERSINEPVHKVMNREPIVCLENTRIDVIKAKMLKYKILCIPLVDRNGKLVKVVTWDTIIKGTATTEKKSQSAKGATAVIIAGGFGTRLAPFTKVLPKPLVPIGDKPIIEHIMDRFMNFGVQKFQLSVNYKASMIKAYFSDSPNASGIEYVTETKPLGTAGSLALLKGKLLRDFFVSNCDILIDADYGDIMEFHTLNENAITLVCSLKRSRIPYGVVELNKGGTLKRLQEKPEYDHLVNTGMYVVNPAMLSLVPNGEFFHFTDLIEKARAAGHKVGVYPITEGAWVDIGQLEDYQAALGRLVG